MLSTVHAYKKLHPYIFGKKATVHNDQKTLQQIILKKQPLAAPMRVQRMILHLQSYDLTGKETLY